MERHRASLSALFAAVVIGLAPLPARAAGDASDVVVEVVDASGGAAVPLARVLLQGENTSVGYTDTDGRARFEAIPTGTYRAAVSKRDRVTARSPLFEVVARRTTTVRVQLARPGGGLQQIGGVSVTTTPARASREVGQDDALRYLDGSLRDALGDLPGLTSSGDGVSIDGNDPAQTGTSVDGVPIPGAGGAFGNRGINADLFGSASASSDPANGSLGGNVGFRTLQPTRFPQQQATFAYGSDQSSSAIVAARGSVRNVGYVVQHASRGRASALTGLTFTDESGLTYRHDGDAYASGDLAKLRWSPSLAHTLTFTASATRETDGIACAARTALYPCGYGPSLFTRQRGSFVTLNESATIGATSFSLAGFASASGGDDDRAGAYFAGVPAAAAGAYRSNARGLALNLQLPGGGRHDLALSATVYELSFDSTSAYAGSRFESAQSVTYRAATLIDRLRLNERLTLTARAGVSGGSGNAGVSGGASVRWQPYRDLTYALSAAAGDAGASLALSDPGLPDPRSLTFDCAAGTAAGDVAAVNAARQRSSSLRANVERGGRRARFALTAWTQRLQNAPVLAVYDPAFLTVPPSYAQTVARLAASPYVCGNAPPPSLAFTGFVPAEQLGRGATLSGVWQLGAAQIAGFATVQSRTVTGATSVTGVLTSIGAQVPDVPLHRAGLVVTEKAGRAVDVIANASYTSANNAYRLPAYVVFNAGFAAPLRYGTLALVGQNLGNRFAGPFVAGSDMVPLARAGAPPLPLPGRPLGPRSVALTYTVRAGRLGSGGSGAGVADASEATGSGAVAIHAQALPRTIAPDALTIDPDNEECTPVAARSAQPALAAIAALRDTAERATSGGRYPASLRNGSQTIGAMRLRYRVYDDGEHYVVEVTGGIRASAALLNCARLSVATADDVAARHLYAGPSEATAPYVAFSPAVGIYLVPPTGTMKGAVTSNATTDAEPAVPPVDPFVLRSSCPASSRPLAQALVAAIRSARDAQRNGAAIAPTDVAVISARANPSGAWLEIATKDAFAGNAVVECLHVAGVTRAHLRAASIGDVRRNGALGFADRFGMYAIEPDAPPASPAAAASPRPPGNR